jgi:CBS domain-containing protein
MQAKDVMTTQVITVSPDATVRDIAHLLVDNHISALPVVDDAGTVVGIVSEGDLIRREEIGTEPRKRSWWLALFEEGETLAEEYIKTHGARAGDIMTRDPITVAPEAPLGEIAQLLESRRIKRVPVVDGGKLVGIVSRANIIQGLAALRSQPAQPVAASDEEIREHIAALLNDAPWTSVGTVNVIVREGVVELWGTVESQAERDAARIAIEAVPGVKRVIDHRGRVGYPVTGL